MNRQLVRGQESLPLVGLYRHRRDGSWYSARPGGADGVVGRFLKQFLVIRESPVVRGRFVQCWWARVTVESTETVPPNCPAASASARSLPWIRLQVPAVAKRRWLPYRLPRTKPRRKIPPRIYGFDRLTTATTGCCTANGDLSPGSWNRLRPTGIDARTPRPALGLQPGQN